MTIIQIVIELDPPSVEGAIIGVVGRPLELPEGVWPWTPALSGVLGMTIGPLVVGGCWEVEMTVEVLVDSIEVEDVWLVGGASVLVVGLRVVVVRRVVVVAGSVVVVGGEVVVVVAVVVVVTGGMGPGCRAHHDKSVPGQTRCSRQRSRRWPVPLLGLSVPNASLELLEVPRECCRSALYGNQREVSHRP